MQDMHESNVKHRCNFADHYFSIVLIIISSIIAIDLMHWRHKGSHLHNNDASAARTCCAGSAHWHSASRCAGPGGPARRCGLQGLPPPLAACLAMTHGGSASFWPPTQVGALLWRHMHMVYCYYDCYCYYHYFLLFFKENMCTNITKFSLKHSDPERLWNKKKRSKFCTLH